MLTYNKGLFRFFSTQLLKKTDLVVVPSKYFSNQALQKFPFLDKQTQKETVELISHESTDIEINRGLHDSKVIRVAYVGYEKGSAHVIKNFDFPHGLEEATLNYLVKFSKDLQFRSGGKLMELGPKKHITGRAKNRPQSWSARATFKKDKKIASYIYHQNRLGKWGDTKTSKLPVFTPGKYNHVAIYVKINKPVTAYNGIYKLWVDGNLVVKHNDIQYRSMEGEDSLINKFLFTTFHGGHTSSYAPKDLKGNFITNYAWFDDIEIYRGKHITLANKNRKDQN